MKIIHRDELKSYRVITPTTPEIVNLVCRELEQNPKLYPIRTSNSLFVRLDDKWRMILEILNYQTQGKRILDLGCGAIEGNLESKRHGHTYHPWLSRFLYLTKEETGIELIGIDAGDLSQEKFPHKQLNLLEKNCLTEMFSENSIDLAVAFMLFNSPELDRISGGKKDLRDASEGAAIKLRDNLLSQLKKIVKPEGIFLWYGGNKDLFRAETSSN